MRLRARAWALGLGSLGLGACADNPAVEPSLDQAYFRCEVQPVLDERCATLVCHGDALRPLRIYSRNRLRLDADPVQLNLPMSDEELDINYAAAAAFVTDPVEDCFLLRKPLDEASGGYYHEGRELYDEGDVFADEDDLGYQALLAWVQGEAEDPACRYVGQQEAPP